MSRVLVVEDSATQALEVRLLLEDAGFAVDVATDGREALAAIASRAPDLVLTDLRCPR
jgi:two-component system sensor histidine kinase/response regulator